MFCLILLPCSGTLVRRRACLTPKARVTLEMLYIWTSLFQVDLSGLFCKLMTIDNMYNQHSLLNIVDQANVAGKEKFKAEG